MRYLADRWKTLHTGEIVAEGLIKKTTVERLKK